MPLPQLFFQRSDSSQRLAATTGCYGHQCFLQLNNAALGQAGAGQGGAGWGGGRGGRGVCPFGLWAARRRCSFATDTNFKGPHFLNMLQWRLKAQRRAVCRAAGGGEAAGSGSPGAGWGEDLVVASCVPRGPGVQGRSRSVTAEPGWARRPLPSSSAPLRPPGPQFYPDGVTGSTALA